MKSFDQFDRDFARADRSFRRFSLIVTVLIAVIWIAVLGSLIAGAVILVRVGPEGLAREAGHLFATFQAAAQEPHR